MMKSCKVHFYLLFLVFIGSAQALSAQFNIKVGYELGYTNAPVTNEIMKSHDTRLGWLNDRLDEMRILHGVQFGGRYRVSSVAFEATWHSKYKIFRSDGTDPVTFQRYFRDVFYRYQSYSLGFEHYIHDFGYGASIDYSLARFRTEFSGREDRFKVTSQSGFSSHFYLSYNLGSNDILTLSIKPYVQVPWSKLDIFSLEKELNPDTTADPAAFMEDYLNFGIMLVFYNGNW